ncbi:MAG TPA: ATP-binding protein, partial [Pseudonocardia sp.]|nr:ATP-binding protein [Pseudonocardia sp.]
PERLDVAPPTVLGFVVVGRIARRHGIRVQLRPTSGGGTTAVVDIPPTLIAASPSARQDAPAARPERPVEPARAVPSAQAGAVPSPRVPDPASGVRPLRRRTSTASPQELTRQELVVGPPDEAAAREMAAELDRVTELDRMIGVDRMGGTDRLGGRPATAPAGPEPHGTNGVSPPGPDALNGTAPPANPFAQPPAPAAWDGPARREAPEGGRRMPPAANPGPEYRHEVPAVSRRPEATGRPAPDRHAPPPPAAPPVERDAPPPPPGAAGLNRRVRGAAFSPDDTAAPILGVPSDPEAARALVEDLESGVARAIEDVRAAVARPSTEEDA